MVYYVAGNTFLPLIDLRLASTSMHMGVIMQTYITEAFLSRCVFVACPASCLIGLWALYICIAMVWQ
jgi:hypothetical protein